MKSSSKSLFCVFSVSRIESNTDENKDHNDQVNTIVIGVECKEDEVDEEMEGEKCTICLCEYEDGDKLTKIPACSHIFHYECISQWLSKSSTKCPLDGLSLVE